MAEYVVLCGQVVGGNERPFVIVYNCDGKRFQKRHGAIRHGLKIRGSDDFNIGVIKDGKLVSLDWMDTVVESDPEELREVAESACLEMHS